MKELLGEEERSVVDFVIEKLGQHTAPQVGVRGQSSGLRAQGRHTLCPV